MQNKTKFIISALGIIVLVGIFSWAAKKPKEEQMKPASLEIESQSDRSGREELSESGNDLEREYVEAEESESETPQETYEKLIQAFYDLADDDSAIYTLLYSQLLEDEALAHQMIADMNCSQVNCAALRQAFLAFYQDQGRVLDGLAGFNVVGENMDLGSHLIEELVHLAGEENLDETYAWCVSNPEDPHLTHGLVALGAHYAQTDQPEVKVDEIMSSRMNLYAQSAFLTGLLKDWSASDSDAALSYFATLEQSAVLDWTIHRNLETFVDIIPEGALEWANYITETDLRELTVREMVALSDSDSLNP